jgi:hypothetical protein
MLKREFFYKFWILFKPNWSLFVKVSNKTEKRKGKDKKIEKAARQYSGPVQKVAHGPPQNQT